MSSIGIIANPASGKDSRRWLDTHGMRASCKDNVSSLFLLCGPGSFRPTLQETLQILSTDSPLPSYLHRWNQLLLNHFPYLRLGGLQQHGGLGQR